MRVSPKATATDAPGRSGTARREPDPATKAERRADDQLLDDDEALIDEDRGAEDLDEFNDDGDSSPGDRRRDPLRRPI